MIEAVYVNLENRLVIGIGPKASFRNMAEDMLRATGIAVWDIARHG